MKRLQFAAMLCLAVAGLMTMTACGGGNNQLSITLTTGNGLTQLDESTGGNTATLEIIAAVGGDTANKGVTWTFEKQSGCSGSGTGTGSCGTLTQVAGQPNTLFNILYTAPAITAAESVIITATSNADSTITKTVTLSIVLPAVFDTTECNPAGVLPCTLPSGANAVPYTATFTFVGGVPPYTYSLLGALPSCLQLQTSTTSATGQIIGTPCGSGTSTFTVQVLDSGGAAAVSQAFIISIAPPPALSLTPGPLAAGTVNAAYNGLINATGGAAPLTFMIKSGSLPPGLSLNNRTGQITGVPIDESGGAAGFYPKTYSFAVQVQDSALPTPQLAPPTPATFNITIQGIQPLSISPASGATLALTQGQTAMSPGYSATLNASGGVAPYTWSVIQGQLPAGLTLSGNPNGTATISGTPLLVGNSVFTVQVADSEVNSTTGNPAPAIKSQVYSIAIIAGTNSNTLFSGQYSFLFNGFDSQGPLSLIGTLTTNGDGLITTGSVDSNRVSGVAIGGVINGITTNTPLGSSYTMGTDGRGTMELSMTFANNSLIVADYDFVMDSDGNIRFFQDYTTKHTQGSNPPTHGEGIMKKVAVVTFAAGSFSGNYAFSFPGYEIPPSGKTTPSNTPAALAGVLHSNGATLTPAQVDFNDNGTFSTQAASGTFAFVAGNQGVMSLTFANGTGQVTMTFDGFFVTPSEIFFMEADSATSGGLPTVFRLAGEAVLQSTSTAFNQTTLAGTSVVSGTGVGTGGNASVFAGLLADPVCNNAATPPTVSYDENDGGSINGGAGSGTPITFTGTCIIGSNGRVGFTGLGATAASTRIAAAYLTGPGTGFIIGSDAAVTTGHLEQQTLTSFAPTSFLDGYTLSAPHVAEAGVKNVIGQTVANGASLLTGLVDEIDATGATTPNLAQPLSATFSSPAPLGRGTLTAGAPVPSGFPTDSIFYIVSPSTVRIVSADTSDTHPELILLDH
jgi:Putative Ig domain